MREKKIEKKTMDKHFEVWKVIFNGEGTEGENYGRKRHWVLVDKIETGDAETAYKDVINNLSKSGYSIVSSEYPVIMAKRGKEKLETYVVSPAGKEYGWADWDDTIAPKIAIRRVALPSVIKTMRISDQLTVDGHTYALYAAPKSSKPLTSVPV